MGTGRGLPGYPLPPATRAGIVSESGLEAANRSSFAGGRFLGKPVVGFRRLLGKASLPQQLAAARIARAGFLRSGGRLQLSHRTRALVHRRTRPGFAGIGPAQLSRGASRFTPSLVVVESWKLAAVAAEYLSDWKYREGPAPGLHGNELAAARSPFQRAIALEAEIDWQPPGTANP